MSAHVSAPITLQRFSVSALSNASELPQLPSVKDSLGSVGLTVSKFSKDQTHPKTRGRNTKIGLETQEAQEVSDFDYTLFFWRSRQQSRIEGQLPYASALEVVLLLALGLTVQLDLQTSRADAFKPF